jgi:hypothetical protein
MAVNNAIRDLYQLAVPGALTRGMLKEAHAFYKDLARKGVCPAQRPSFVWSLLPDAPPPPPPTPPPQPSPTPPPSVTPSSVAPSISGTPPPPTLPTCRGRLPFLSTSGSLSSTRSLESNAATAAIAMTRWRRTTWPRGSAIGTTRP